MPIRGASFIHSFHRKTLAFMTASTRALLPPGTAIRETGDILVTLIEAERAAAMQKAEAAFVDRLEYQKQEADHCRKRLESETTAYRERILELEAQNARLQVQLRGEMEQSQILNNTNSFFCQASQGTIDPRNLMKDPLAPKPSATFSLEQFGVFVDKDTISFQGHWMNFWKELATTAESTAEDAYTRPMTPGELERLLNASIDNARRNKEERDSFAQSIMGVYTQF
ncbi:hypothetical protein D9619_005503 [Psilocybe cf. subviscida]|uniref:Uncharacterized protein n=1 Tax=Psilocybe cf. subviscida TaxID=2480587 RepID=A0A8H5BXC8_9AGAR|nr:hypothetical protein D9619_005503 [Psilocybe cf. subviscida]